MIIPACGAFNSTRLTAAANTVFRRVIPPFMGNSGSPPKLFQVDSDATAAGPRKDNWNGPDDAFTHLTDLFYTSLSTAHSLYVLRPLNYSWVTSAVGSNTTAITLAYDPGTWATAGRYKYGNASGGTNVPNFSNNTIAANDIVAYQLTDGTWQVDVIASGSGTTPVLTTGTPNVTGAGIAVRAPIFFFGIVGDTDPGTGLIQPLIDVAANTTLRLQGTGGMPLYNSLHKGDPLVFVSSNGTDAGILEHLGGFYSKQF